ncbi:MAG: hypothetical protein MRY51_03105 [Flavobacteriaceae bacterium]|nr:hypothetical protein [Flavobacteriaceae bacterium]MCI5089228.1 hypothetical protein [Flavobacteriaceae bacterium]
MRKWPYIFLALLMGACDWFVPKETLRSQYVNRELQAMDWETVDQFPLFSNCDETASKQNQKQCFEQVLTQELGQLIEQLGRVDSLVISGSYTLSVVVDAQGQCLLSDKNNNRFETATEALFFAELSKAMQQLESISPALKQGIPVATQYLIPLEIHLD